MLPNTVSQSGSVIKKSPSKLIEDQLSGKSLSDIHRKPEIIQFLNIADYSIYPNTNVPLDEPLFLFIGKSSSFKLVRNFTFVDDFEVVLRTKRDISFFQVYKALA